MRAAHFGWLAVCAGSALHCQQDRTPLTSAAGHSGAGQSAADGGGAGVVAEPRAGRGGASAAGRAGSPVGGSGGAGQAAAAGRAGQPSAGGAGGAGTGPAAGGGGGNAGAGDGSAGAGAGFFGASRCADADFWLCEDFESGSLDKTRWQAMASLPKIDSVHAARGSKALHVSTGATAPSGITTTEIFPTPDENYWGRLFVYFEQLPSSPVWAHWTIVGANPTPDSAIKGEIRVGGQLDTKQNRFGVGTDHGPTGDWTNLDADPKAAKSVPVGSWICVEWQHDGGHDQTRFFWDGEEHPSLGTTPDTPHGANSSVKYLLPTLGSVWFGFWNYDQGKTTKPDHYDVWLDEIALAGERIGCER